MMSIKVKDGMIYLDEVKITGVKKYRITSSTNKKGVAELVIVLDVSTVRVEH